MSVIDPFSVAIVLLVAGVLASLIPLVPGGLLSILGIGYYWLQTGSPGTVTLVILLTLGIFTVLFDWLGGAISATVGGASLRTTAISAIAGIVLLLIVGPLGLLVGIAGTVFIVELRRHGDIKRGFRTAGYAAIGVIASTGIQLLLTITMLVGFVLAVW